MQLIDGRLVFSPSDLNNFLECPHLTRLDVEVARGRELAAALNPDADLLKAKGEAHEAQHLELLERKHGSAVRIGGTARHDWAHAARATREAILAGAPLIYQATLATDRWRGKADFLVRVDSDSRLGWGYEVWDTKLARHAKPKHLLQLAYYSDRVGEIQGCLPEYMHVILGTGVAERYRCRDVNAYLNVLSSGLRRRS